MQIEQVRNLEHNDDFIFGIAVGYVGPLLHSALIYKINGSIKCIDFVNQKIRSNYTIGDLGHNGYVYIKYNRDVIFDAFAMQVPSFCELIKDKKELIDFGIKYTDTKFNEDGDLIFAEGDYGLTCSTFILSILNAVSIQLINAENWQNRPEDLNWQNEILTIYYGKEKEEPGKYSQLIEHYKNNIGCFRFNPADIAAASACEEIPASFEYCNSNGRKIIECIL